MSDAPDWSYWLTNMCSASQPSLCPSIDPSLRAKHYSINTHQHVFCQPAFPLPQYRPQSESEAFLAQQGVSAITTSVGADFILIRNVSDNRLLGVARPVVCQFLCNRDVTTCTLLTIQRISNLESSLYQVAQQLVKSLLSFRSASEAKRHIRITLCVVCHFMTKPEFCRTHVAPAKAKRDIQTDGQTDKGQSDPYVVLCFAGATKMYCTCTYYSTTKFEQKQVKIEAWW